MKNKFLLLVFAVMVLGAIVLLLNVTSKKKSNRSVSSKQSIVLTDADKDTYVNTIQTMNERNRELEGRVKMLEGSSKDQLNDQRVEELVQRKLDARSESEYEKFKSEMSDLISNIPGLNKKKDDGSQYEIPDRFNEDTDTVPKGLGLDSILHPEKLIPSTSDKKTKSSKQKVMTADELLADENVMVTISPFTQIAVSKDKNPVKVGITGIPTKVSGRKGKKSKGRLGRNKNSIPFYTIPRNATLFNNTTLTAMLGVVPNIKGSVLDPIRFKIITGSENLATNGHFIKGIRDIVWSGISIGNREMSCVRGEVHSVTFTFDDGRVYTQSSVGGGRSSTTGSPKILGYISDTRGTPCLKGELITNASDYLFDRMVASAIGSTAGAYAKTQESSTVDANGNAVTTVTGSDTDYITGKTLESSLGELTNYVRERQRGAIDLVYLSSGQDVVLHIEDEIRIDYLKDGRKLNYANTIPQDIQTRHVSQFD